MKLKVFQKGFNYSQDGRGNRLVWHLQGCNMHCPWCANPEGMLPEGVLMTDPEQLAESCCPRGAVKLVPDVCDAKESRQVSDEGSLATVGHDGPDGKKVVARLDVDGVSRDVRNIGKECLILDRAVCAACTDRPCVTAMRQKGLHWSCSEIDTEEMIEECVRCAPMFFDGGGVTLTGGEMSLQFDAVRELLHGLGREGIGRCVETNGSHPRASELFPLTEEWIMDLKHTDSAKHRVWLGISNEQIKATLEAAAKSHPDVLIRIPLMPGFNDQEEDAQAFAAYLAPVAARDNVRVEVLTFHEFGKNKWGQCGMAYRMKPGRITAQQRAYLEEQLADRGLHVVRT